MKTVTFADLFGWEREVSVPEASPATPVETLVGWFDVRFCAQTSLQGGGDGDQSNDPSCIELTTSPHAPPTHWAHTTMLLQPPLTDGALTVRLQQSRRSHHDLNVTLAYAKGSSPISADYAITADFRGSRSSDDKSFFDYEAGVDRGAAESDTDLGMAYDD
jgi:hypothetical protein